ncbi:hypothetical protein BB561_004162 [Smittium simulii]|uniref:Uncharacterized protein n=1 Tax=Smittium simulii TaxID=133385 RepID=A0A2T9YHP0_9FUNG|nr:hypothetical protein BB561_004162 [Smittium simulii]
MEITVDTRRESNDKDYGKSRSKHRDRYSKSPVNRSDRAEFHYNEKHKFSRENKVNSGDFSDKDITKVRHMSSRDREYYRDNHRKAYNSSHNRNSDYKRTSRSRSPQRKSYSITSVKNQLEDSEKARKAKLLELMAQDAKKVNEHRKQYVNEIRSKEKEEEMELNEERIKHSKQGTTTSYLQNIADSAYGQLSTISLEDRLRRNRAFISKELASGE